MPIQTVPRLQPQRSPNYSGRATNIEYNVGDVRGNTPEQVQVIPTPYRNTQDNDTRAVIWKLMMSPRRGVEPINYRDTRPQVEQPGKIRMDNDATTNKRNTNYDTNQSAKREMELILATE